MRRAVRWTIVAGVIGITLPALARGDEASAEHEAQTRFEEGIARVKASNFEGARLSFTEAYEVLHKPYILWNLALADEKSGHLLDALGHFKKFVNLTSTGDDRANAEKHIGELMGRVGRLHVTAPPGAQVVVDGTPAGTAPWSDALDVMPGSHHVEARTAHDAKETDAQIGPGELVHVSLAPVADAPAAAALPAPARIVPATTATASAPPAGSGMSATEPSWRLVTVAGLGAAAAVSIAFGVYFGLQSHAEKSTVDAFARRYTEDYCQRMGGIVPCSQWNDAVQSQNRDASLSDVFYIAGGVLAAGAVATWLLWPEDAARPGRARLTPTVAAATGLGVAGRF